MVKIIKIGQYFTELFKKWPGFFQTRCSVHSLRLLSVTLFARILQHLKKLHITTVSK